MSESPGWSTVLEDGLVMRGATPGDADRLAEYNAEMHRAPSSEAPDSYIGEWTRDVLSKPHPRTATGNVIIVEDTATGQIVSSTAYFNQVWAYGGISIPAAQPEIVSTHPDYRNRGLIRKQFNLMHRWGVERGHLVQGITGIPYYYRQFGYEMALEMTSPRRAAISALPAWKSGEQRSLRLRPATRDDVPLMLRMRDAAKARSLFTPDLTAADLEYELFDRSEKSAISSTPWVIETASGTPVGFTAFKALLEEQLVNVYVLEFASQQDFRTCTEPFWKAMRELVISLPGEGERQVSSVTAEFPSGHPAQPFLGRSFAPAGRPFGPDTWYVRTPDLPKLLMLIAPKLEERLAGTGFAGLTGEKIIGFYRSGLKLTFDDGKLSSVNSVRMPDRTEASVNLPDLTFLQLLFGRKSFTEIATMFSDASSKSDADTSLIDTLFPKQSSDMAFAIC